MEKNNLQTQRTSEIFVQENDFPHWIETFLIDRNAQYLFIATLMFYQKQLPIFNVIGLRIVPGEILLRGEL